MNDEATNLTTVTPRTSPSSSGSSGAARSPGRPRSSPRSWLSRRRPPSGPRTSRNTTPYARLRGGRLHRQGVQRAPDGRQQVRRALRGRGHPEGRRQDLLQALQLRHARGRLPRRRHLPEVRRLHEEDADPGPPARGLRRPGPVRRDHGQGRRSPPDRAADDRARPPDAREEPPPPAGQGPQRLLLERLLAARGEKGRDPAGEDRGDRGRLRRLRPLGRDRGPGPEVLRPRGLVGPLRPDLPEPERPAREEAQEGLHPARRLGLGQVAPQVDPQRPAREPGPGRADGRRPRARRAREARDERRPGLPDQDLPDLARDRRRGDQDPPQPRQGALPRPGIHLHGLRGEQALHALLLSGPELLPRARGFLHAVQHPPGRQPDPRTDRPDDVQVLGQEIEEEDVRHPSGLRRREGRVRGQRRGRLHVRRAQQDHLHRARDAQPPPAAHGDRARASTSGTSS